jgi:uncharacterized repeat protein (TIGR03837 family)
MRDCGFDNPAMPPPAAPPQLHWDLFCRVVDNHGDLGVCWRLARRLAALSQRVRLWVDDATALAWMAPEGAEGVTLLPWREPQPHEAPGDVVIEAFGCDPPAGFVQRMQRPRPPVWVNLEYLSAEPYVERSHGLRSPQLAGPGGGLSKWFFYPGFTAATGGLLCEDALATRRQAFDAAAWLAARGIAPNSQTRRISLFCYHQPALPAWLAHWQTQPTQLLVAPGPGARQVAAWLGADPRPGTSVQRGALQVHWLPWLPQPEYDHLLWSCDLNHVRGEDSLVRALWAARPFVWQLYPQRESAHAAKLDAFLALYLAGADAALAAALRSRWAQWNGLADPAPMPAPAGWAELAERRSAALAEAATRSGDLGERLYRFALAKR